MHPPILMFNDLRDGLGALLIGWVQNGICAQLKLGDDLQCNFVNVNIHFAF